MSTKDTSESQDPGERDRGTKRPAEGEKVEEKVHSANDWEHANLGDDDRKQKFLRLMGATKKEHGGRFIIGDGSNKHRARSEEDTKKVTDDLEDQFQDGIEHKLSGATRKHFGFGFAGEDQDEDKKTAEGNTDKGAPDSAEKEASPDTTEEKDSSDTTKEKDADEDNDKSADSTETEKKVNSKMLNFVKASS